MWVRVHWQLLGRLGLEKDFLNLVVGQDCMRIMRRLGNSVKGDRVLNVGHIGCFCQFRELFVNPVLHAIDVTCALSIGSARIISVTSIFISDEVELIAR